MPHLSRGSRCSNVVAGKQLAFFPCTSDVKVRFAVAPRHCSVTLVEWRAPSTSGGGDRLAASTGARAHYNILTRRLVFGHIADCTSSYHAEALAILHALADNNFTHVTIYTDSQSVMDTLQRLHRHVNTNFSRLEQTDVWLAIWTLLATSTPPPLPPQGHRPPRHRPPSDHLPELWESVPRSGTHRTRQQPGLTASQQQS